MTRKNPRVVASKLVRVSAKIKKSINKTSKISAKFGGQAIRKKVEVVKEEVEAVQKSKSNFLNEEPREGSKRRKQVLTVREERFSCTNPGCAKSFKNEADCNFHIKNRCNKPPRYKCPYCQYRTFHSANVKRHIGQSHKGQEIGIIELYNPREESRIHVCPTPDCGKKYKYRCNLTTHLNYECGKPPRFKCSYCDFKNSYKHIIKKHWERKHINEDFQFEILEA